MTIEKVWQNILDCEGQTFTTFDGETFTYKKFHSQSILPNITNKEWNSSWALTKTQFRKALDYSNYKSNSFFQTFIGAKYIKAILEDGRINY